MIIIINKGNKNNENNNKYYFNNYNSNCFFYYSTAPEPPNANVTAIRNGDSFTLHVFWQVPHVLLCVMIFFIYNLKI